MKAQREDQSLSFNGLARQLNIAPQNIQRIETGGQGTSLETVAKLCKVLGVDLEDRLRAAIEPAVEEAFTVNEELTSTDIWTFGSVTAKQTTSVLSMQIRALLSNNPASTSV